MKRLLLCFLLVLVTKFLFAQKREIQASISVFPANFNNFSIEAKYKYSPVKALFTLNAGVEYLQGDTYFMEIGPDGSFQSNKYYNGFQSKKLMIPFTLNFCIGHNYIVYGGGGLFFSANFNQKSTKYIKPTLFQIGSYFNTGFQFKIKKKTFLNIEAKLLKDLSSSYQTPQTSSHFGFTGGMENVRMAYFCVNVGASYRFIKNK
jgi:outer membrane protein W